MSSTLFRVVTKHTTSVQPSGTHWRTEVHYCGPDRDEARIAYHTHRPADVGSAAQYGMACTITTFEVIEDAGTDSPDEDTITTEEA